MTDIQQLHERISNLLNTEFTKDFLQNAWLPLVAPVVQECGEDLREKGLGSAISQNLKKPSTISKADIVVTVALLFTDTNAYDCFRKNLPKEARILWDGLVFNGYIGFGQAIEQYKVDVQPPRTREQYFYYHGAPNVKETFKMLPCKNSGWGYSAREENYFYLPFSLREILIRHHAVPAWAQLSPMDTLPEGALVYVDAEEKFLSDYYRLQIYHKQGMINYTSKWRPVATGLTKVQKAIKIAEFFPDSDLKRHRLVRTNMLASVIVYLANLEKKNSEPQEILREFFQNYYTTSFPAPPVLLPDIKGLAYIENNDFTPFGRKMLALLKAFPSNSYVPIKNILGYCTSKLIEMEPISRYTAYQRLTFDQPADTDKESSIGYNNYKKMIQRPLLRGSFFFFAALGLCELAYEQVAEEDLGESAFSAWDGLLAVRRTALGDYVCGLTDTYQVSEKKGGGFTLSDDALLIRLDSPDSPYASTLEGFAEKTGPLTFRTDPHFFLKSVYRKADLVNKIELFRQMVPGTIPGNWEDFFKTLLNKIDPLKSYDNCIVFNVDKENQELVRLLAQDPLIKPLIYKAEGYLIIVPKKNYAALRNRLAEFGFLQT
jgi:hypothetical protein